MTLGRWLLTWCSHYRRYAGCKCSVGYTGDDCSQLVGIVPFTHPFCSLEGECVCDAHGNHCDSDSRTPDTFFLMMTRS